MEQKATIARLADASSATPKKEDPLEYVPHYDGHTQSPGLVEGAEPSIEYSPWQKGRDRSKAAHQGGDKPRPLDCRGTPVYDVLVKTKDIKKSGRYHEYTNVYSSCSFLWDVIRFLTDVTPALLDKDQPIGLKADAISRIHNSLTGIYDLLNLRANVVELLVVKDCADGTFLPAEVFHNSVRIGGTRTQAARLTERGPPSTCLCQVLFFLVRQVHFGNCVP